MRITVELVEVQGRCEGTRCRSVLIPPNKLKHNKGVGRMDSGPQSESGVVRVGAHSKMSPTSTSTLRGLGLGETALRRWEAVTEMA